jgi:hypothetical protein
MISQFRAFFAVLSLLLTTPTYAADNEVDAICNKTMSLLQAGKVGEAFDASLGKSPLMVGQTTDRDSLVGQMEAGMKVFGPISSYELIKEQRIGTMAVRRFYFAQHSKMVSRWEIDLARTTSGWVVSYFGYDVKVQEWDADD